MRQSRDKEVSAKHSPLGEGGGNFFSSTTVSADQAETCQDTVLMAESARGILGNAQRGRTLTKVSSSRSQSAVPG